MREWVTTWVRVVGPVRTAFIGSLLLSIAAVMESSLLNRDGMLYVESARAILDHGRAGLQQGIDWPFQALLMAALGAVTGLNMETVGYLLCGLFMAGTCGLIVAITRRSLPEAAWAACLIVLAMPAYNAYRNEVLREYGFWFFSILAFWLAMRWDESHRWREAIACQLALACAALFRLEAVAFFPALMMWQAFSAPAGQRIRRVLLVGGVPLACAAVAAVLLATGLVTLPTRAVTYLEAVDPLRKLQLMKEAASSMSEMVFKYKYSREEAGYILFFGLLSVIPMKFLKMSGIFVVPLAFHFVVRPAMVRLSRWQPLPWAFLAYIGVLVAFVTHQFFLVGRYVCLLNFLAVPVMAAGLMQLMKRFPRWGMAVVVLAFVTMAANVVSLSPRKTHIIDAGRWLAANVSDPSRVYVDNPRIAYYAGLGYLKSGLGRLDRQSLAQALDEKRFDMIVLEQTRKDTDTDEWIVANRLRPLQRFVSKGEEAVIVAVPASAQ